jgi:hypothetical protein
LEETTVVVDERERFFGIDLAKPQAPSLRLVQRDSLAQDENVGVHQWFVDAGEHAPSQNYFFFSLEAAAENEA